jgi:hypothetical protein
MAKSMSQSRLICKPYDHGNREVLKSGFNQEV